MMEDVDNRRGWWDWFGRVALTLEGRAQLLRACERELKSSGAARQAAIKQISQQIHALEQDALVAERLRRHPGMSEASTALENVAAKLDWLSARLCDLLIEAKGLAR